MQIQNSFFFNLIHIVQFHYDSDHAKTSLIFKYCQNEQIKKVYKTVKHLIVPSQQTVAVSPVVILTRSWPSLSWAGRGWCSGVLKLSSTIMHHVHA